MSDNLSRIAAFARELADVVEREVRARAALDPQLAAEIGLSSAQHVCDEFAGQLLYFPMGLALRISERDEAMYEEYCRNGRDAFALAKQFGMCVQTAYKRVRVVEAARYAERQGNLFDAASGTEEDG